MIPHPPRRWSRAISGAAGPLLLVSLLVPPAGSQVTPPCRLCEIAGRIDRAEIESTVRALSGADSVDVGGDRFLIHTRATLHPEKNIARDWLIEQVRAIGYEPALEWFLISVSHPDLQGSVLSAGGDTLICAGYEGKIYRICAPGGWRPDGPFNQIEANIFDLQRDPQGILWAAGRTLGSGYGELLRSADGGASWTPFLVGWTGNPVYTFTTITFAGPDAGVAAGAFGTVITLRRFAGEWLWYRHDSSLFFNRVVNGTSASGPLHIWAVGDAGGLFESPDLGGTWSSQSITMQRLWDIDFHDAARGVIVGENVTFHTADSGRTWQEVPVAAELRSVLMHDSVTASAAGVGGGNGEAGQSGCHCE